MAFFLSTANLLIEYPITYSFVLVKSIDSPSLCPSPPKAPPAPPRAFSAPSPVRGTGV